MNREEYERKQAEHMRRVLEISEEVFGKLKEMSEDALDFIAKRYGEEKPMGVEKEKAAASILQTYVIVFIHNFLSRVIEHFQKIELKKAEERAEKRMGVAG